MPGLCDVWNPVTKMLERHFIAASNVPHAYHPILASSAVAYAYASKLPPSAINDLVAATDPALGIDSRTMRHIVYHKVASQLDPSHYSIADDMVPDEWGDIQYAPSDLPPDVPMEDLQQNLQQLMFQRRAGIEGYDMAVPEPMSTPGKLDPSRIAHLEQLQRHGNLEEAIRADDQGLDAEPESYEMQETPSYYEIPEAPSAPDMSMAPQMAYTVDDMPPPMFEEFNVSDAPSSSISDNATSALNDLDTTAASNTSPEELAEQESDLHKVYDVNPIATPNAQSTFHDASDASLINENVIQVPVEPSPSAEESSTSPAAEQLKERIEESTHAIEKNEEKKEQLNEEIEEQREEVEQVQEEVAEKEQQLVQEENKVEKELNVLKKEEQELKKEQSTVASQSDSPAKTEKLKTLAKKEKAVASAASAKEHEIKDIEAQRKRNAERADKVSKGFQKFLKTTRREANKIDDETGFSKRAKEEATAKLNETVDRGFDKASKSFDQKLDKGLDKGFNRFMNVVDRKINTSKVTDAVVAEAAKKDPVWRDITAEDRSKLAAETERQTESLVAIVDEKEKKDDATIDELTASKQLNPKTANRIKRLLTSQNTAALNVAIKSFAHDAGAKLGLTSKKFSALMKELEQKGGKFSKELAVKLREYAPIVKETLHELSKGAGTLTREVNKQLGPIIKEWGPIIMKQVNEAGSMALTEVIKQIPNLVAMVVQIASKSGKSAIGADMDGAPPRALLHSQWQNGGVAYEELIPTDPVDGVYMFPDVLDAAEVLHHAADMARDVSKSSIFWMIYLRLYLYVSQMCREHDDWFIWCTERTPLLLGASPITLSASDKPAPATIVEWVHHFTGVPYTSHNEDALRTFIELTMRGCVSLSDDCRMHAKILMRTPAAGIGFDNLSLL